MHGAALVQRPAQLGQHPVGRLDRDRDRAGRLDRAAGGRLDLGQRPLDGTAVGQPRLVGQRAQRDDQCQRLVGGQP